MLHAVQLYMSTSYAAFTMYFLVLTGCIKGLVHQYFYHYGL